MIERWIGCVEHAGRIVLRRPKQPFRTRRYLHSAFWLHGAGNIDLPAWWKFLLRAREHEDVFESSKTRRLATKNVALGLQKIILNLLYPVRAHTLIQRLNRATRSHRQATQHAQQGVRKYTSVAEDLLAGRTGTQEKVQETEKSPNDDEAAEEAQYIPAKVEELLERLTRPKDYENLWLLHQDAFNASKPLEADLLRRIFSALSASRRRIDLERSLVLFVTLDTKSPMFYKRAVRAALKLHDLDTACIIHLEAVDKNPGSIDVGTPEILKYAVMKNHWKLAIETWYRLWQVKILYFSIQRDLWKGVDTLSLRSLVTSVEKATDFALSMTDLADPGTEIDPSQNGAIAAREFALSMAERAFEATGGSLDEIQYLRLLEKLKTLSNSSTKFPLMALNQLLSFNKQRYLEPAVNIYRELHLDPGFTPSQSLLDQLIKVFGGDLESATGMFMVLRDWQRFLSSKLTGPHYVTIARVLAKNGDADGMEHLFRSFLDDYKTDDTLERMRMKVLNGTLWVHCRRADPQAVLRQLDELQNLHGFIPDTKSYNTVIRTFTRVGDIENALSWFQALKESGVDPDEDTFSILMRMYGMRGDIDAVEALFQESKYYLIDPNHGMLSSLVWANVKAERHAEAETIVEEATHMGLRQPPTMLWNILLNAHSLSGNMDKVSALHQRMLKAGVPENSWTYSALLSSLCTSGSASAAIEVVKKIMPKLGVECTALHYSILIGGCLRSKQYEALFSCYRDMLKNQFVPDKNVQGILLRAAALTDRNRSSKAGLERTELTRAHEVLDMVVQSLDQSQLANIRTRRFPATAPDNEAFTATYYQYMIHIYGTEAAFDKVAKLYDEYIAMAKKVGQEDVESNPPMIMLVSLLSAHVTAGNDAEVDRCWQLAFDKISKLSMRSNANLAEPGWVLPARKYIINPPLRQVMKHLVHRGRLDDMITLISDLRWAGYELHSPKWNDYIQYLADSPLAHHRRLAFELCEQNLMQDWPGWSVLAYNQGDPRESTWWRLRRVMRSRIKYGAFLADKRVVTYRTMVVLASVYLDARSSADVFGTADHDGEVVSRADLARLAPITVNAVRELPKIPDPEQSELLRK